MIGFFRAVIARILSFFSVAKPVILPVPVSRASNMHDIVWHPINRRPKGLHASYKEYTKFADHFFYLNKSGVAIATHCGTKFKVVKFTNGVSAYHIIHSHVYGKSA